MKVRRHVSATHKELHLAHVNFYATREQSDLGAEYFTLIRILILNEENAQLMLRLLQYLLINVRTLRWAKLVRGRYGSLKKGVLLL